MVFSGKPSKACQRCRDRRLKCDLCSGSCGQCVRAKVVCSGYRDTQQLRIRNESEAVRRKVLSKTTQASKAEELYSLPLSLEVQAREAFFVFYVTDFSTTWDFLKPFYHPVDTPEYLTVCIDAVSLAYLGNQVYSAATLIAAREKYVSALRMTNRALQCSEIATQQTSLLASLLLDLFEKFVNNEPRVLESWTGHVSGALALVRLRGLDRFRDATALRVLVRLSTNLLITCVTSETPVPDDLQLLRDHAANLIRTKNPKWLLTDLMVQYAALRSVLRRGYLDTRECISGCVELDTKFLDLTLNMPPSWKFQPSFVAYSSERIYEGHFDKYKDRHVTQTWNVARVIRIFLNESILEYCSTLEDTLASSELETLKAISRDNIAALALEICASVPQFLDCPGIALESNSRPSNGNHKDHMPFQRMVNNTLIFPLYVAGRTQHISDDLRSWTIQQLWYMGSHFGMRNASFVAQFLESGKDVSPWAVYFMLGGYAFAS